LTTYLRRSRVSQRIWSGGITLKTCAELATKLIWFRDLRADGDVESIYVQISFATTSSFISYAPLPAHIPASTSS
jgi:hypothetical protein